MFYITDYITKMSLQTYEMLSLLSKAVLQASESDSLSVGEHAKTILHKCLTQFTKQQQIHGQQAAYYIHGHLDGFGSHTTVPMLSNLLLAYLKQFLARSNPSPMDIDSSCDNTVDSDESEIEPMTLRIRVDKKGKLLKSTQIDDYIFHDCKLDDVSYYDFVRYFRIEKIGQQFPDKLDSRLGTFTHYQLLFPHALFNTHQIVEHTSFMFIDFKPALVPCVIGVSIPRNTASSYGLFVLGHFKPFHNDVPLVLPDRTIDSTYASYTFLDYACKIMNNWKALYKSEDEQDAERLRKQEALTWESQALTKSMAAEFNDDIADLSFHKGLSAQKEYIINSALIKILDSKWFQKPTTSDSLSLNDTFNIMPNITQAQMKLWKTEIATQEQLEKQKCYNALDFNNQMDIDTTIPETEHGQHLQAIPTSAVVPESELVIELPLTIESWDGLLKQIISEETLNTKQEIAFQLITNAFFGLLDDRENNLNKIDQPGFKPYLRLLLSEPGGTGKTHVVHCVQHVMKACGCQHNICFLAPSGSAAALIDGMTVHKGLSIKIQKSGTHKSKLDMVKEDYTVMVNIADHRRLREEFKNVMVLMCDEVSLLSLQLLAEMDHALQYALGNNEFFGGIIVIFAGDFYQFPPVFGSPLYTPIKTFAKPTEQELLKWLG